MAAGKVVGDLVARDGHLDVDRDQRLGPGRVLVDEVGGRPGAVRKLRHLLPGEALDIVLALLEGRQHGVLAVLVDQFEEALLAEPRGLALREEIAHGVVAGAGVPDDHLDHVQEQLALGPDAHRRDPEALAEVALRVDVEGAGCRAADVRPVAIRLGEGDELAFDEHRPDDAHVAEMRAAGIGVVGDEDVARVDVVLEAVDDRLAGKMQRADMDRDVTRPLHHRVALGVAQAVGEVATVDDEGIAGAEQLLRHLVDEVAVGVFQNLEGDAIESHRFGSFR
jgi:hypothetical protein